MILHDRQMTTLSVDWHERVEHARTFLLIPAAQMPSQVVRRALMQRALHGGVCYACLVMGEWLVRDGQSIATPRQWAIAHGYLPAAAV